VRAEPELLIEKFDAVAGGLRIVEFAAAIIPVDLFGIRCRRGIAFRLLF
jgi:hypothetical protein